MIEFVRGGDLMFHMQRQRRLPEEHARLEIRYFPAIILNSKWRLFLSGFYALKGNNLLFKILLGWDLLGFELSSSAWYYLQGLEAGQRSSGSWRTYQTNRLRWVVVQRPSLINSRGCWFKSSWIFNIESTNQDLNRR